MDAVGGSEMDGLDDYPPQQERFPQYRLPHTCPCGHMTGKGLREWKLVAFDVLLGRWQVSVSYSVGVLVIIVKAPQV